VVPPGSRRRKRHQPPVPGGRGFRAGGRISFGKRLNLIPSLELFARSAARCKELGWVLKVNLPEEGLAPLVATVKGLKDQPRRARTAILAERQGHVPVERLGSG
jgi:hypothetical protein